MPSKTIKRDLTNFISKLDVRGVNSETRPYFDAFDNYLDNSMSGENMMFLILLKKINGDYTKKNALFIWKRHLVKDTEFEINISSDVKSAIASAIANPEIDPTEVAAAYKRAYKEIARIVTQGPLLAFFRSDMCDELDAIKTLEVLYSMNLYTPLKLLFKKHKTLAADLKKYKGSKDWNAMGKVVKSLHLLVPDPPNTTGVAIIKYLDESVKKLSQIQKYLSKGAGSMRNKDAKKLRFDTMTAVFNVLRAYKRLS